MILALVLTLIWLAGTLTIALLVGDFDRAERVGLLLWPVAVPVSYLFRVVRRSRYTCPDCRGYFRDCEHLRLHQQLRTSCPGVPIGQEPR